MRYKVIKDFLLHEYSIKNGICNESTRLFKEGDIYAINEYEVYRVLFECNPNHFKLLED